MSAVIFPSEQTTASRPSVRSVRVKGGVSVSATHRNGASYIADIGERDGYKVRLPRRAHPPEAVIINTGGGIAGGDDVVQSFNVASGAALTVTTQASERSYRALDSTPARVTVTATVGHDATFAWLPQETILFDRTRLARTIDVDVTSTSRVLIAETVVFGRRAMGEVLTSGHFSDNWCIRRNGRLCFAEAIKHEDATFGDMSGAALTAGAHVATTALLVAPGAENLLGPARTALSDVPFECAASAWDGKLVVRGLANRSQDVRHMMQKLVPVLGGLALPRVWWT